MFRIPAGPIKPKLHQHYTLNLWNSLTSEWLRVTGWIPPSVCPCVTNTCAPRMMTRIVVSNSCLDILISAASNRLGEKREEVEDMATHRLWSQQSQLSLWKNSIPLPVSSVATTLHINIINIYFLLTRWSCCRILTRVLLLRPTWTFCNCCSFNSWLGLRSVTPEHKATNPTCTNPSASVANTYINPSDPLACC